MRFDDLMLQIKTEWRTTERDFKLNELRILSVFSLLLLAYSLPPLFICNGKGRSRAC